MTEITAPKSAVTAEQFADEIREQLKYTQGVTVEQAKPADVYVAASAAVRRHLVDSWMKTQADMVNGNTKAVGYLSAEFLMGKQLENALLNAGLTDQFNKAVKDLGFSAQEIIDAEYEPGLGNGGLGRLAACFIDSLASLGVPAFGYGIQYKYGIFEQKFDENGKQISDVQKIIADKTSDNGAERTFRCQFNLKSLKYSNTATYYLVIADEQGLQMPQREPFQIDIAFAVDEFDFFS